MSGYSYNSRTNNRSYQGWLFIGAPPAGTGYRRLPVAVGPCSSDRCRNQSNWRPQP